MSGWLRKPCWKPACQRTYLTHLRQCAQKAQPHRGRLLCPHAKASDLHGAMGHTWITDALGLPAAGGLGKLLDRAENGRSEAQAPHSSQIPF